MAIEDEAPVVHGSESTFTMTPWWLTVSGVSGNAHKLYAILMHYADNHTLVAWPSRATLAKDMGLAKAQTLDRYISELEEAGALRVKRRSSGGVNLPNQYRMNRGPHAWRGSTENGATGTEITPRVVPENGHELEPLNYNQDTSFASVGAKRATTYPKSFAVPAHHEAWARDSFPHVDVKAETEKFRDYHLAKGSKFKSWEAAWRTWIRNADKFQKERQAFQPQPQQGKYNMAAPVAPYQDVEELSWR